MQATKEIFIRNIPLHLIKCGLVKAITEIQSNSLITTTVASDGGHTIWHTSNQRCLPIVKFLADHKINNLESDIHALATTQIMSLDALVEHAK